MPKICAKCGKRVQHTHTCSHCKQEFCKQHSRHFKSHYFCVDCLKKYYKAPVRKKKVKKKEPELQKQAGKPSTQVPMDLQKMVLPAIILIVVLIVAGWGTIKAGGLGGASVNDTDNQTGIAPAEDIEFSNDTSHRNVFSVMMNYLDVTNYSLVCSGYKVVEIELKLKAGGRKVEMERVEIGSKVVNETDWSGGNVAIDSYGWVRISDVEEYANITLGAEPEIGITLQAENGINQKIIFTPNVHLKCR
ncbi:hypothetical protein ACFLQI_02160 [Candidatus Undinarchaeota archaeon]